MDTATYRTERNRLIAGIKKIIKPRLWKSGYATRDRQGNVTGCLQIWLPKDKRGKQTGQKFPLRQGFVCNSFKGLSSHGVLISEYGEGWCTLNFSDLPLEDLFGLHTWVTRKFVPAVAAT